MCCSTGSRKLKERMPIMSQDQGVRSIMKAKAEPHCRAENAEPEIFEFKAKIPYLIKSKAKKCHILRNQHRTPTSVPSRTRL